MINPDNDLPLNPPEKGETLFREGGTAAPLGADTWDRDKHYPYTRGYLLGARALVERARQDDASCLVYPVVFLYRHSIELILKQCILLGSLTLREELAAPIRSRVNRSHDLIALWDDYLPILRKVTIAVGGRVEEAELEGIGDYIGQLAGVDPQSFAFRYPVKSDGVSPPVPEKLSAIDIDHLHEQMEKLVARLDGYTQEIYDLGGELDHAVQMDLLDSYGLSETVREP